jgi:hypothetical protein
MPLPTFSQFLFTYKPKAIRSAEQALGVTANNYLHVEPMNELWGSGNPNQYLSNTYFMAYDDHRYLPLPLVSIPSH